MIVLHASKQAGRIEQLAFAPDGRTLAGVAQRGRVHLWPEYANSQRSVIIDGATYTTRAVFSPDGTALIAGYQKLAHINLATREISWFALTEWFLQFAISPAGQLIVGENLRDNTHNYVCFPRAEPGKALWRVNVPLYANSTPLFVGDRFMVLDWDYDKRAYQFDERSLATGEQISLSPPLAENPEAMVISPQGDCVAAQTRGFIYVYPLGGTFPTKPTILNDTPKYFTGIAYHPSGKYLAATSNDMTVKLYDTTTWEIARTFTWKIGRMRSVTFSPDGTLAAAGSEKSKAIVWDVDL